MERPTTSAPTTAPAGQNVGPASNLLGPAITVSCSVDGLTLVLVPPGSHTPAPARRASSVRLSPSPTPTSPRGNWVGGAIRRASSLFSAADRRKSSYQLLSQDGDEYSYDDRVLWSPTPASRPVHLGAAYPEHRGEAAIRPSPFPILGLPRGRPSSPRQLTITAGSTKPNLEDMPSPLPSPDPDHRGRPRRSTWLDRRSDRRSRKSSVAYPAPIIHRGIPQWSRGYARL